MADGEVGGDGPGRQQHAWQHQYHQSFEGTNAENGERGRVGGGWTFNSFTPTLPFCEFRLYLLIVLGLIVYIDIL